MQLQVSVSGEKKGKKKKVKDMNPLEKEVHTFNKLIKDLEKQKLKSDTEQNSIEELELYSNTVHLQAGKAYRTALFSFLRKIDSLLTSGQAETHFLKIFYHYAYTELEEIADDCDEEEQIELMYYHLKMAVYVENTKSKKTLQNEFNKQFDSKVNFDEVTLEGLKDLFNSKKEEWIEKEKEEEIYEEFKDENIDDDDEDDDDFFFGNSDDFWSFQKETMPQKDSEELQLDIELIFKELVKRIHPDLTRDPVQKEKREKDMQRLNKARAEKNLYDMILIRSEYMDDNNRLMDLELLKRYNKFLKNEISKLNYLARNSRIFSNFFGYGKSINDMQKEAENEVNTMHKETKKFENQTNKITNYTEAVDFLMSKIKKQSRKSNG